MPLPCLRVCPVVRRVLPRSALSRSAHFYINASIKHQGITSERRGGATLHQRKKTTRAPRIVRLITARQHETIDIIADLNNIRLRRSGAKTRCSLQLCEGELACSAHMFSCGSMKRHLLGSLYTPHHSRWFTGRCPSKETGETPCTIIEAHWVGPIQFFCQVNSMHISCGLFTPKSALDDSGT